MAKFRTYTQILGANVANNATFVVTYTNGENASTYDVAAVSHMQVNNNDTFTSPAGFTIAYGGSNATVTNKTGATLLAGATVIVEFWFPATNTGIVTPGAAVVNLTNSSGGTSGGNTVAAVTDTATAANAVATLTVKLNALLTSLRGAGFIT